MKRPVKALQVELGSPLFRFPRTGLIAPRKIALHLLERLARGGRLAQRLRALQVKQQAGAYPVELALRFRHSPLGEQMEIRFRISESFEHQPGAAKVSPGLVPVGRGDLAT